MGEEERKLIHSASLSCPAGSPVKQWKDGSLCLKCSSGFMRVWLGHESGCKCQSWCLQPVGDKNWWRNTPLASFLLADNCECVPHHLSNTPLGLRSICPLGSPAYYHTTHWLPSLAYLTFYSLRCFLRSPLNQTTCSQIFVSGYTFGEFKLKQRIHIINVLATTAEVLNF